MRSDRQVAAGVSGPKDNDSRRWHLTAETYRSGKYMDPVLAAHFRQVYLDLVRRWVGPRKPLRILKTDVFAEATCPPRAFSWELPGHGGLVSFDISAEMTRLARSNAVELGYPGTMYAVADARFLPFAEGVFDLIVSDSTLDHFEDRRSIHVALRELARVLRPGGTLVVTLDNPRNITQPLMDLWVKLRMAPYFIGATLSRGALVRALRDAQLDVVESGAILHNPRFFTKAGLRIMHRTAPQGLDRPARTLLELSEGLGRWPTRELTGLFVVACALKRKG